MTISIRDALRPTHDSFKARFARFRSPGFSWCGRCGMPWSKVESHSVQFDLSNGMFPLCKSCWQSIDTETQLDYCHRLADYWAELGHPLTGEQLETLTSNVKAGVT